MPKTETLSLATLAQLHNGTVGIMFHDLMKKLGDDCQDRPALDKDRALAIVVRLRPRTDKKGNLQDVAVDVEFSSKLPNNRTNRYMMDVKKDGTVYFHPDDKNDPNATHLYDGAEDGSEDGGGKKK